eukprot:jgi/Ulvmu1/11545/UM078_0035.1
MLRHEDQIAVAHSVAEQLGTWTPRKVIYTNGSSGTSRPYSIQAKRCFGSQVPPRVTMRPLVSRAVARTLPHVRQVSSPTSNQRLRDALKEAREKAREAQEHAIAAMESKQVAESRMEWYKKRESKLLASRRKLESQNDQAMKAVSHAHDVVIALQKSLAHQGTSTKSAKTSPRPSQDEVKAVLQSALANVVDLQSQNKLLLEQLKGANDEIADNMETEQLLSAQLQKANQQIEAGKLEATKVATEVQQLHRSMLEVTTTISTLLAANSEAGQQKQSASKWNCSTGRLRNQQVEPGNKTSDLEHCREVIRTVSECMDCLCELTS